MYSLRRGEELIRGEEFANIIGRAGRARIDIEGQILFVMFEPTAWRLNEWRNLVNAARHRRIQSGLAILIQLIAKRISHALSLDGDDFLQYVTNNTDIWDKAVAADVAKREDEERRTLEGEVESLDAAILALVEDHDIDIEMLPTTLDAILQDSLWVRTLARKSDTVKAVQRQLLGNRARYIWENSSGLQRKGYFAAGVSFKTGKRLDEAAAQLNSVLFKADLALESGDSDEAIAGIVEFAEIVFTISPFMPDALPAKWREILGLWLKGEPMSAIVTLGDEHAIEFIEDDVIYRLVWAAEAVRVRSRAHIDEYSELWTGRAAEALEVGTMHKPAAVLLQAGLGSRAAALASLVDQPGDFDDYAGMREWLRSEAVEYASTSTSWPTPDTSQIWRQFALSVSDDPTEEWKSQSILRRVVWNAPAARPPNGTAVRLVTSSSGVRTDVSSADYLRLGRLQDPLPTLSGVLFGVVQGGERIEVKYSGPGVLA